MSVLSGEQAEANRQAAYAATLADEWARNGVSHAVVCPGSRSAPLAVALAQEARIALHVRLDERSAGFTALGIGLATGHPAVVVTTSGTAAVELHAAVIEADLARVPLVVCTADRPPELRDVGAAQTIDQGRVFGSAVRWRSDPGVADASSRRWWRSLASRSVAEATTGPRGPGAVHLNLPFREPLVGVAALDGGAEPGRPSGLPWHRVVPATLAPPDAVLAALVPEGEQRVRGLVVAGARCGDPAAVLALGRALGWPVLADPCSGLRVPEDGVVTTADALLRSPGFADAHPPDILLRLGERWASKAVNDYLATAAAAGAQVVVVDPYGRWPDPERNASAFLRCDPTALCRRVLEAADGARTAGDDPAAAEWWRSWTTAEERARSVIAHETCSGPLDEPALAHRLFAAMPGEATLVVSSSMPIRDVETFAPPRPHPPRVLANRGANGIDGVVSTALGVAIGSAAPTVALVGDLAFLHDVSALTGPDKSSLPLTIVVADNRGGGIFSFLEQAAVLAEDTFELLFGTPQAQDPASVAAGFDWPVDEVDADAGAAGFEELFATRVVSGSPSVIRVRLPDRSHNAGRHRELHEALSAAVRDLPLRGLVR